MSRPRRGSTRRPTYSEKLKDPRWQKRRLSVLERDGWACVECSDDEATLHVHHLYYSGEPWEAPDDALQTLCEGCHADLHLAKKSGQRITSVLRQQLCPAELQAFASSIEGILNRDDPVEVILAAVGWMLSSPSEAASVQCSDMVKVYEQALRAG